MNTIESSITALSVKATKMFLNPKDHDTEVISPCFYIDGKIYQGWLAHFNNQGACPFAYQNIIIEGKSFPELLKNMLIYLDLLEWDLENERNSLIERNGYGD